MNLVNSKNTLTHLTKAKNIQSHLLSKFGVDIDTVVNLQNSVKHQSFPKDQCFKGYSQPLYQ